MFHLQATSIAERQCVTLAEYTSPHIFDASLYAYGKVIGAEITLALASISPTTLIDSAISPHMQFPHISQYGEGEQPVASIDDIPEDLYRPYLMHMGCSLFEHFGGVVRPDGILPHPYRRGSQRSVRLNVLHSPVITELAVRAYDRTMEPERGYHYYANVPAFTLLLVGVETVLSLAATYPKEMSVVTQVNLRAGSAP